MKNREMLRSTGSGVGGSSSSDPSGMDGSSPEDDEEEPSPTLSDGPSPRKQSRGYSSDGEGHYKGKDLTTTTIESSLNDIEGLNSDKFECNRELTKDSSSNVIRDEVKSKQSGSDAEADTEKSNTEEMFVQEKKKRKILRKRKRPQKRSLSAVEKTLEDIVGQDVNIKSKDLLVDGKSRTEDVLNNSLDALASWDEPKNVDALDRVKQQAMALDPNEQQVPTTAALLRHNKN